MANTPKLQLTYFDFHGGRGEPARLALHIGGIPFEDIRIKFEDWPAAKSTTLFGSIPMLSVDGVVFAQSNTINRYVGKLANLYPNDALQAAFCDEAMDVIEDIGSKISATMRLDDDEKKRQREVLAEGPIPFFLRALASRLAARGGNYFADNRLTVADLKVAGWIKHLRSGVLDHIPNDLPERIAPALVQHFDRVMNEPKIKAYYASRS